jgi:hypothetical protein
MTIPILGSSTGSGGRTVCVVCGGDIGDPNHKHIYTDVKLLAFYDDLCKDLILNGCMIITEEGQIFWGHPRLKAGYVWAPTPEEVAFRKKEAGICPYCGVAETDRGRLLGHSNAE